VAAEGVFARVDYDAGVEEGGAEGPEDGAEAAWLGSVSCLSILSMHDAALTGSRS
jgi:hypothetical protein